MIRLLVLIVLLAAPQTAHAGLSNSGISSTDSQAERAERSIHNRFPLPARKPPALERTYAVLKERVAANLRYMSIQAEWIDLFQLRALALNIYHEARGEDTAGQAAVAHVTLNRLRSPKFPNNIWNVVYQYGQFSWTLGEQLPEVVDLGAWEQAVDIAFLAVAGVLYDTTGGALYYYAPHRLSAAPKWAAEMQLVTVIGLHHFFFPDSM